MHPLAGSEQLARLCFVSDWCGLVPISASQGYGFLSENATFVDICNDHGLEFIGPKSDSIRVMGDKSTARDTMKARCALLRCAALG